LTTAQLTTYPVHPSAGFFAGPWRVRAAANGDILLDEFTEGAVGRFDSSRLTDSACTTLVSSNPSVNCVSSPDSSCRNPCIKELFPAPGFHPGEQLTHGLVEDTGGNLWFNQGGFQSSLSLASSVGYWKADRSGIVLFPTLQLFPDSGDSCFNNTFFGYSGTGITVNQTNGEIWIADYCRKRIGRLRKIYNFCG